MIAVNGLEDGSISVSRFLHLFYLLPSLACFLTYTSLSVSLTLSPCFSLSAPPFSLVSSWQPINRVPLSPLMAQLLALMHFKRTAAATSQSDGKYMSSSDLHNICPFLQPILSLCSNVLRLMLTLLQLRDSGHHL